MERKKMMIDFSVTIACLVAMASVAIIGLSAAMEPFTSYDFNGIDEASIRVLLQIYGILKTTRLIVIAMLFISIVIKSLQFVKVNKLMDTNLVER